MAVSLFALFLISIVIALLLAPLESLGWWAGWFDSGRTEPAGGGFHLEYPKRLSSKTDFVLFLDGIARADKTENIAQVGKFLKALELNLPDAEIIYDLFPYSISGIPLTEQRPLSRFWQYANRSKIDSRISPIGFTVNLRNMLQVATSADRRYGPVYFQGETQLLLNSLFRHGYDIKKPARIFLVGYSGGAQMALGAAPYLQRVLDTKVTVISIGGVMSSNHLLLQLENVDHLEGSLDFVQKIGSIIFPRRWLLAFYSNWRIARRKEQIRIHEIGPMTHIGKKSYIDDKSFIGQESHFETTLNSLIELIAASGESANEVR